MHVISPDMLADLVDPANGLPLPAAICLTVLGAALVLTGWRLHRFWIVLAATLGAGIAGLRLGPDYGVQPIVAGLLAAVAAGTLALSLARVAIFLGCGLGCWQLVQAILPQWAEPAVCILAGGLLGIVLFRLWVMLLTCSAGVLLLSYGGLTLAVQLLRFDAVQSLREAGGLVDVGYGVAVLVGVLIQYVLDRARRRRLLRQERKLAADDLGSLRLLRKAG
jgi:hypothetical protein